MNEFIPWESIDPKNHTSGQHKVQCPKCLVSDRTNKTDTSFSINLTTGVGFCHYCHSKTVRDFGKKEEEKEWVLPEQNWRNYTALSENFVKWFENRGISQSTLIGCRVTEEKGRISFNYFEGEKLVNKKFRTLDKKFSQTPGTKNIFYGINDCIGAKEVYVTEGEIDKISLYEVGVKNAISVPNGANDNDDVWINSERYLEGVEKFYIATDMDEKGNELSEKIAQRLGRWRCERVEFKNKDANEDLMEGRDVLEKSLKNKKRYPVNGTFTVSDLEDEIYALYDNGLPDTIYPKKRWFGDLKDVFSVMRGHLVTGTGIPSHGKSSFTDWYVMNLLQDYDMKGSWFSPEHHPMGLHQANFIQRFHGKPFFGDKDGISKVTRDEIEQYKQWADEKIYLTGPEDNKTPTWGWLFDKFKEQLYSFGVDIFVIDAFNKVQFDKKGNKLDLINETLTELTSFAQRNNVIIFLIAHPTKMSKDKDDKYITPSLYDVAGSAEFRNQTHDGFCIYREYGNQQSEERTTFTNLKTKFSFQGKIGETVDFKYHVPSGRFFANGYDHGNESLTTEHKFKPYIPDGVKLPYVDPKDAFEPEEEISDIPF